MAKGRAGKRSARSRKLNTREVRQRFLIICEGEKTEPFYFESFRVPSLVVKIKGFGCNPTRLLDRALKLRAKEEYDQVWCVFDRDDVPKEDFLQAIATAKSEGIWVAYSNPCFELWYVLHFEFLNTGITRPDYYKKLTTLLGWEYQKNSKTIYHDLLEQQPTALRNAENLLATYELLHPADDDPSTTVHQLVQQLNRFSR